MGLDLVGLFTRPRRAILPTLQAATAGTRIVTTEQELRKAIADARKGDTVTITGVTYNYAPYDIQIAAPIGLNSTVVLPEDIIGLSISGRRGIPVYAESAGFDLFRIEGPWQSIVGVYSQDFRDSPVTADAFVRLEGGKTGAVLEPLVSGCLVRSCDILVECEETALQVVIEGCVHQDPGAGGTSISLTGTTVNSTISGCPNLAGSVTASAFSQSSIINCTTESSITISGASSLRNRIVGNYIAGSITTSGSSGSNYIGGNVVTGSITEHANDIINTGDASGAYNV